MAYRTDCTQQLVGRPIEQFMHNAVEPPENGHISVVSCREVDGGQFTHKMANWCIFVCPLSEVVLISELRLHCNK